MRNIKKASGSLILSSWYWVPDIDSEYFGMIFPILIFTRILELQKGKLPFFEKSAFAMAADFGFDLGVEERRTWSQISLKIRGPHVNTIFGHLGASGAVFQLLGHFALPKDQNKPKMKIF